VLVGLFYIFSTNDWRLLLTIALANVALVVMARINLRALLPLFRALLSFGLIILIFQLLFQEGDTFWSLGPIGLHTSAFAITGRVWLRLASLALLFITFLMWTHTTDIALMWESVGVPYRYALLGALAIRFFPILQAELGRIQEAQQVRGRPLHTLPQRVRGLFSMVLPFILRALRRTNEIAVAMELRAFGYERTRTYRRSIQMKPADWLLTFALLALALGRVTVLL
jgi:energy-coupling factor transport system permease protein